MLHGYLEDAETVQDDERGGERVERRVRYERGEEASGALEEDAQGDGEEEDRGQEDPCFWASLTRLATDLLFSDPDRRT